MSRGVLMYAHNNAEIDYLKIACANALMVQKNLNVPVTLVTDRGTRSWGNDSLGTDLMEQCFENIIVVETLKSFNNKRSYNDTSFSTKTLQFYNCNHWEAYSLSPYDETLFIDADYLVMSNSLDNCWGSHSDVMINHRIFNTGDSKVLYSKHIDDFGIRQYWATVIYFNKSEFSKSLFELVRYIQDNYLYCKELYHFSNGMYRNDYAFSIAVHMLHGFTDLNSSANELPISGLLMSWDTDDIYAVNGINDITLYSEQQSVKGTYTLIRLKNQDVHIMNKWACSRVANRLIELYRGTA